MRKQFYRVVFSAFCLMAIAGIADAQTGRDSVPAAEVNGTFRMNFKGKYKGSSSEIKILALGGGKLRVAMALIYPYTMQNGELMANIGELDEKFAIDADNATFETKEFGTCKLSIKFVKPGTIKVTQEGSDNECGFGTTLPAKRT